MYVYTYILFSWHTTSRNPMLLIHLAPAVEGKMSATEFLLRFRIQFLGLRVQRPKVV